MTKPRHQPALQALRALAACSILSIAACVLASDPAPGSSPGMPSEQQEPPGIYVPVLDEDGEYTGEFELEGQPEEAAEEVFPG